ncbi:MAG: glycosyltransferase family 2 protein [Rhodospirillales bacterium]|jgi:glycosyltransferase involved in cell wall biosynthesis|nr:glycosyltransferase family 2 protein [Rhodospirillales bacterium]
MPPLNLKKLSVVIPCYNEESTLAQLVDRVTSADTSGLDLEILIINDASTDGSAEIAKSIASTDPRIVFEQHEENMGKGAALRTGFNKASGDIVLVQDADLEYSPSDYPILIAPILSGRADVVFGSRFIGGASHRVLYFWHSVGNKVLTVFSNMMTNLNLTDMETCYKVFKKEVIDQIEVRENRFGFEPEITAKISKIKPALRIYEVGITYDGRTYGDGKKITWKDGISAIFCILKYNI